jgi:predicted acylesterase/phospholipase RssA/CRP-like cAMP-binding protein
MRRSDYSFEAQKIEVFRSAKPFQSLPQALLELLAQKSEYLELQPGDTLFQVGDVDEAIYVVLSGGLDILAEPRNGRRQALATFIPGDCIGEGIALFHRPRKAAVHASRHSELAKLSLSLLAELFESHPRVYTELQHLALRHLLSFQLASCPLLEGVDLHTLRRLDTEANWFQVAGGETLFSEGDVSDYLYIIVSGRLEVSVSRGNGRQEILAYVGRDGVVGELDLLTGDRRSTTVRAARDTQLVRLSREQIESLIQHQPQFMGRMVKTVATAFRDARTAVKTRVTTVAIVPIEASGPPPHFMDSLLQELAPLEGRVFDLSSRRIEFDLGHGASSANDDCAKARLINWLAEYENEFPCLLLECDPTLSPWTALCIRHADLILIVAPSNADSSLTPLEAAIFDGELKTSCTRKELVLVHPETTQLPSGTSEWLRTRKIDRHYHILNGRRSDYQRLARFIADKPVGVVLSGGGARGLAHVGALQALERCGVPIDSIAGTSIGAAVAGKWAMDMDLASLVDTANDFARTFGRGFFRDLTFPAIALISSRRLSSCLKKIFGNVRIEDLWIPYFCNSSNLSKAEVALHNEGLLWTSVRTSSSIPGVWPPMVRDDGNILVDGGLMNNLPVDLMRARCPGSVIAIDVSPTVDLTVQSRKNGVNSFAHRSNRPHIFNILSRASQVGCIRAVEETKQKADLYLQLPTEAVDFFDWKSAQKLMDLGYAYCLDKIEQWKR